MDPRLLRPFLLTGVGAAGLWGLIYAVVGAWVPAVIALATAATILVLVIIRERLSLTVLSNLAVAVTYVGIGALVVTTGGYRGLVAPWLLVLAIVSAFFLTPRGTAIWSGILILLTLGLVLAPRAGLVYPDTIPAHLADVMFSLSLVTAVASGGILIYFFARLQYGARAAVGEANRNLLSMLDTVPEPLVVFEPEADGRFRCTYANAPMTAVIGEDPSGRLLEETPLPELEATRQHLTRVVRSGRQAGGPAAGPSPRRGEAHPGDQPAARGGRQGAADRHHRPGPHPPGGRSEAAHPLRAARCHRRAGRRRGARDPQSADGDRRHGGPHGGPRRRRRCGRTSTPSAPARSGRPASWTGSSSSPASRSRRASRWT
jgi:hypothetical protein